MAALVKSPLPGGEDWTQADVESHVRYMMGPDLYERMLKEDWKNLPAPLWRDTFHISDYKRIPNVRNAVALDDMVERDAKLDGGPTLTEDHIFPLRMSDGCRERGHLLLSSSRLIDGTTWVMLYPRVNRLTPAYYRNCIRNDRPFRRKACGLLWRGVDSGNIWREVLKGRSNRLEISKRWDGFKPETPLGADEPAWDIGITNFLQCTRTCPGHDFDKFAKGKVAVHELIQRKYTLCIEGNDVSSQFLWALAAQTVPIHPYPFFFETYWFDGGDGKAGLEPWVHFVPIKHDASDLAEKYDWCLNHPSECVSILNAGRKHAARYLSDPFSEAVRDRFVQVYSLKGPTTPKK